MKPRLSRPLTVALAALLVSAACSGGESAADPPPAAATSTTDVAATVTSTSTSTSTSTAVESGEETLRFVDVTGSAGVTFTHATPFDEENYTPAMDSAKMIGGAVVGDFTGDGLPDVFVIGGGLGPDAFFVNQGDGTFEDRAEQAGLIGEWHLGSGAAAGDYDGDGRRRVAPGVGRCCRRLRRGRPTGSVRHQSRNPGGSAAGAPSALPQQR